MHFKKLTDLLERLRALPGKLFAPCHEAYCHAVRPRLRPLAGACDALRRSRLTLISALTAGVLLLPMFSFMRVGVALKVDGRMLGYVEDQAEIQNACRTLEQESSEVLGQPFSLDADISYELVVTTPTSFIAPDELTTVIADNVDSLATIAVVKVDGEILGATAERSQAEFVLDEIKAQFTSGAQDVQADFVQEVVVETMQAPTELLQSEDDLLTTLTAEATTEQIYTVDEDDTMTSIAREQGMTRDDLLALNPDVIPERMAPGSTVIVQAAAPVLSVKTVRTLEYTEEIPFDTIETDNPELAQGKTNTTREGVPGTAAVKAEITEINGTETERTELSRTVTLAPVDAMVEIGTKKAGIGSGALIRPTDGVLTSGYKFRWGRQHKGLDFGVSTGSPIVAADGGRVITSEYSRSGYGYYIIIDHGNGMTTLYAHNSQLIAQVGDVVEQGELIAYSGNTGNSTGPHCHFEVMLDGTNVNPADYV